MTKLGKYWNSKASQTLQRCFNKYSNEICNILLNLKCSIHGSQFGKNLHSFAFNSISESIRNLFLRDEWICRALQSMTQYNHAFKKWFIHHQKMEQIPCWRLYQLKIIKQVLKHVWKKTSSPSGSHLGHYRTALTSDSICFVYATLISIPFDCGFTLDRWTNALLVMLEKNKGTPSLNKLRVIQLMEADSNMVLRIVFGKSLYIVGRRIIKLYHHYNGALDQIYLQLMPS